MPIVHVGFVLVLYNSNGNWIGTHRMDVMKSYLDVGLGIMGINERWVFRNLKHRFLEAFPLQLGGLLSFDIFHLDLPTLESPAKVIIINDNRCLMEILRQKYWKCAFERNPKPIEINLCVRLPSVTGDVKLEDSQLEIPSFISGHQTEPEAMDAVANVISYDLPDDVVHYNPANNAVQKDVKSYERGYLLGLRNRPESLKKPTVTARWLDDDDFEGILDPNQRRSLSEHSHPSSEHEMFGVQHEFGAMNIVASMSPFASPSKFTTPKKNLRSPDDRGNWRNREDAGATPAAAFWSPDRLSPKRLSFGDERGNWRSRSGSEGDPASPSKSAEAIRSPDRYTRTRIFFPSPTKKRQETVESPRKP